MPLAAMLTAANVNDSKVFDALPERPSRVAQQAELRREAEAVRPAPADGDAARSFSERV